MGDSIIISEPVFESSLIFDKDNLIFILVFYTISVFLSLILFLNVNHTIFYLFSGILIISLYFITKYSLFLISKLFMSLEISGNYIEMCFPEEYVSNTYISLDKRKVTIIKVSNLFCFILYDNSNESNIEVKNISYYKFIKYIIVNWKKYDKKVLYITSKNPIDIKKSIVLEEFKQS
jgi:hypothetical protein